MGGRDNAVDLCSSHLSLHSLLFAISLLSILLFDYRTTFSRTKCLMDCASTALWSGLPSFSWTAIFRWHAICVFACAPSFVSSALLISHSSSCPVVMPSSPHCFHPPPLSPPLTPCLQPTDLRVSSALPAGHHMPGRT